MDADWIVPALAAMGVPLVIGWAKSAIDRGDKAQQKTIDSMQDDIKILQTVCSSKAGIEEHKADSSAVLAAVTSVARKVDDLNSLVLTELGKRPTREEVMALFQTRRHDG